jgi:membrane protease YdiL (CAAX protease family)
MRALVFVLLAYLISWGLWYGLSPLIEGQMVVVLVIAYMFGPMLSALVCSAFLDKERFGESIGLRWRPNVWWLIAWLAAPVLVCIAIGLSLVAPGATLADPDTQIQAAIAAAGAPPGSKIELPPFPVLVLAALAAGVIPNGIAAFGEEAGWRGYLWGALRPSGFWKSSLAIGAVWGLWHAPLIAAGHNYGTDYAGAPWSGIATMTAFCVAMSPILGFIRDRAGSVIAPSIFHGTLNALGGFTALFVSGGSPLLASIAGAAGIGAGLAMALLVALLRPNRTLGE